MIVDWKKVNEKIFLIFLVLVFICLLFLVGRQFTKTESQKILEKDLKEIKSNQKQLIENEKNNYKVIDSLKKQISVKENFRDKIIEKHYYTKEVINNKIKEDEKNLNNSNVSFDTIKKYLSNYKYKPFTTSSN
jgi:hypothetical protein